MLLNWFAGDIYQLYSLQQLEWAMLNADALEEVSQTHNLPKATCRAAVNSASLCGKACAIIVL